MTKLLAAVIGAAFVFAAANFTYAQAPAAADRSGVSAQDPRQDMAQSQGMSKKKVKKAKKAKKTKKRTAKRSRGMARPTPPGTDTPAGTPDTTSAKPRPKSK